MSDSYVDEDLARVYRALTVDSPIIRYLLSKVNHLQPLHLTPPVSLDHLHSKLYETRWAAREVELLLYELLEFTNRRLWIPHISPESEIFRKTSVPKEGIDCEEEEDKEEWTEWMTVWNKGVEAAVKKLDALDDEITFVKATLCDFLEFP
ncbi:MAG: hypothetical protein LQ350_008371 [Teloschistes chrysophthalmus]|nr:MAG: hypothetical protein LQ350_008371 [Niorma chrysophthalma]